MQTEKADIPETITEKINGVLVEPRLVKQIYMNIVNFQKVMKDSKLYFHCGKNTKSLHLEEFKKYPIDIKNVIIKELNTNNLTPYTYSDLFKSLSFWENMEGDYILTIQTDGCLCAKSPYSIKEFTKYDYVGGYAYQKWWWKETKGLHDYTESS